MGLEPVTRTQAVTQRTAILCRKHMHTRTRICTSICARICTSASVDRMCETNSVVCCLLGLFRPNARVAVHARDWSSTGFGLLPVAGDQIMIARNSNDDYAYMTLSRWCAGAAWSASDSDPTCGGTGGHPGFGYGNFFVGSSTTATTSHYLNGCALTGGCNNGGVDGIGFTTLNGWANSAHSCYGGVCVAPLTPLHTRPTLSSWDLGLP